MRRPPPRSHVTEINGLAVDPSHQGEGVAPHLVAAAVAEAGRRGARKVSLRVLGPNALARRLYERCAFMARPLGSGARREWVATTHDWAHDVDVQHWIEARRAAESLGGALALHLVLECL